MPTYQYACTEPSCAHEFELVQSFTDPAASECPVCGHRVRKVYGSVGVVFKGSGFYRTDSRSDSSGAGTSAKSEGSSDGAKTDTKSEKKSESSTAAKSDTSSSSSSSTSSATPKAAAS